MPKSPKHLARARLNRIAIVSVAIWLTVFNESLAQFGNAWPPTEFSIEPSLQASTEQGVSITVGGIWPVSCVPSRISHTVESAGDLSSHTITLAIEGEGEVCLPVLVPWSLTEELGQLSFGLYDVEATLLYNEQELGPDKLYVDYPVYTPGVTGRDFDDDVDLADLNNVRNSFGAVGEALAGDTFPFDGDVDIDDLNAVRNHFGERNDLRQAVPESDSMTLVGLAIAVIVLARRHLEVRI